MRLDACFKFGKINKPHGLKGDLKVTLEKDFPLEYATLESIYVLIGHELIPFFIKEISVSHTRCVLKLEDFTTPEAAKEVIGKDIYLPFELLPGSEEAVLYYKELIGYTIEDVKLGKLGIVTSVMTLPGQDILVMEYKNKEVLIPASEELIVKADRKKKILQIEIPDGLLDIYLS